MDTGDFEYAIQMTRWLLQPLGIWPMKTSNYSIILRTLSIAICIFLLAFLLVPCCLHMFLIEKDIGIRLKMIGPLSFCLMNIFKYFAVLFKRDQIGSCILDMASDWHKVNGIEQRGYMMENAKTARLFTMVCAFFMYGGGLPYSTILPLTRETIIIANKSYQHLAYPSYFIFFNPHIMPMYGLVFFTHCLCGFVMYSVTCGVCSIAILCTMHVCSQCSITSALLHNFTERSDNSSFRDIIQQHLRSIKLPIFNIKPVWSRNFLLKIFLLIIEFYGSTTFCLKTLYQTVFQLKIFYQETLQQRFASKLEDILNEMCLVELIGCTFNICMLGYYFMTEFEQSETIGIITFSLLLISLTFNIFIFCYIGDLLTENCRSIGEAAYMTNWYQLSSKKAEHFILIVATTQQPVELTAGKMVTLSLRSFCNVLKASVTYLNMLRTLTGNT